MNGIVVLFGVVFPSGCVLACFLVCRFYLVRVRTAANGSRGHAEAARLAAKDADGYADEAYDIAGELREKTGGKAVGPLGPAEDPDAVRSPSVDDQPTEVMERVVTPDEEDERPSVPLARTPAQRMRAAGSEGKHRLSPSPVPRHGGGPTRERTTSDRA